MWLVTNFARLLASKRFSLDFSIRKKRQIVMFLIEFRNDMHNTNVKEAETFDGAVKSDACWKLLRDVIFFFVILQ